MTKPECRSKNRSTFEERTAAFGEVVIAFAKRFPMSAVTLPLIDQLVRSATSVGANYGEADDAKSKEAKHWLRMVAAAEETLKDDARPLYKEAMELNLIFGTIRRGCEE